MTLQLHLDLERVLFYMDDKFVSRVKIRNALEMTDSDINDTLSFGCDIGVLTREEYNFYKAVKRFRVPENAYYDISKQSITKLWLSEKYGSNEFYIEETARKDSKIAGPWTRPDLTLVSYKKFPWTIGSEFDVVTFEIKAPDACNVLAVFEALSHASAATRAYVVFPVDWKDWKNTDPDQEKRVMDECSKHGVGLVLIGDVSRRASPVHVLKARKREIDHDKCSDFLGAVLSPDGKNRISVWK